MIVVFDTNIWQSTLWLQSPAAAATRFFMRERQARVGLPEIVRLEVEEHLRSEIRKHLEELRATHERLLRIFGALREVVIPDDAAIEGAVARVFGELGVDIVEVPFSHASARSSFLKTIRKLPPSDRGQQFKDGVLWADCVSLLEQDDVWLVTSDAAFYDGRDTTKGPAPNLLAELSGQAHRLHLIPSLAKLLQQVRVEHTITAEELVRDVVNEKKREGLTRLLGQNGFRLGELIDRRTQLFATEDPSRVFCEFMLRFDCPSSEEDGSSGRLEITGDGSFNSVTRTLETPRTLSEVFKFRAADGSEEERSGAYIYAEGITLGHREIRNVTRYSIDG